MDFKYILVLITASDEDMAQKLAKHLLEKKLVACVNIVPQIRSLYNWQGRANDDREVLLLAKSRADLFEEGIVPAVKAIHPYDLPEIIAVPIVMGSNSYLEWIQEETSGV